jgi:hypothetical protein
VVLNPDVISIRVARRTFRRSLSQILRGALVLACVGADACGTAAVEGGAVCTYREVIPCLTDAGCQGTQECLPDLSGYGPCTCSEPDSGAGSTAPDAGSGAAATDGGS